MDPGDFEVGTATAKQSKKKINRMKIDGEEITCLNMLHVELHIPHI